MRWIGQHIWDFISRFRTTVYLENLETSSEENVLVVDSDGKVTKNTTLGGSDLTITNAGVDRVVTSSGGSALDAEADFKFYPATSLLQITADSGAGPLLNATNTADDATAGSLTLANLRDGGGHDDDYVGSIYFQGKDSGTNNTHYVRIDGKIVDAADGSEAGSLELKVAENDSTLTTGLKLEGQPDDDGEVDVTIGAGAASVTTIAGTLTMGSTAALTNAGLVAVAAQTGITACANLVTVGTIGTGTWQGTAIASAYLDADTAHLSGDQTFTGKKQIDKRSFSKTSATHWEYQGEVLYFGSGSTTQGQLCYLKENGEWGTADADGAATGDDADRDAMGMLAIALGTDPDVDGMFLRGTITMDADVGDVGNPVYVSTAAGRLTGTAPTASGDFVRVCGYCLDDSDGQIWFNPDSAWVEIA